MFRHQSVAVWGRCLKMRTSLKFFAILLLSGIFGVKSELMSKTTEPNINSISGEVVNRSFTVLPATKISSDSINVFKRKSRALSLFQIYRDTGKKEDFLEEEDLESVQKTPTKSRSNYVIPYLRPGRLDQNIERDREITEDFLLDDKNKMSVIPAFRYERSMNVIPNVRFGRSVDFSTLNKRQTIIPVVRFGRSDFVGDGIVPEHLSNEEDAYAESFSNQEIYEPFSHNVDLDHLGLDKLGLNTLDFNNEEKKKRNSFDTDYIIPYPRLGKSIDEHIVPEQNARSHFIVSRNNLSILPQMRYGRSMSLFTLPKLDFSKQSENRLSESTNDQEKAVNPYFVLPYPRPGRSETPFIDKNTKGILNSINNPNHEEELSEINPISLDFEDKKQNYMLPYAKLGLSDTDILAQSKEFGDIDVDEFFRYLKQNASLTPIESKDNFLEQVDNKSIFIIPYPRPGKRSFQKRSVIPNVRFGRSKPYLNTHKAIGKTSEEIKIIPDFILPYPRPGKKRDMKSENWDKSLDSHDFVEEEFQAPSSIFSKQVRSLVPYPRPGRSMTEEFIFPVSTFTKHSKILSPINTHKYFEYQDLINNSIEKRSRNFNIDTKFKTTSNENESGASSNLKSDAVFDNLKFILPYPRPGRSGNTEAIIPYPRPGRSSTDREGSFSTHEKLIKSSIVPYPRPGRSDRNFFLNSKFKRSVGVKITAPEKNLDYSSSSSKAFVLPYPRPGRSNIVPYPRPGRSNILPYPRPGRSKILPYPRPGRSNILPYPRPGRSDILPYPRPGRSDILPYPRPGRSNILPYPRPGRSNILPYPRPGRSNQNFILPYPRYGKSIGIDEPENASNPSSNSFVLPYPRLGRSSFSMSPTFSPYSETANLDVSPTVKDDLTGNNYEPKFFPIFENASKKSSIVPYPRLGRSSDQNKGYVLPYPRVGRQLEETNDEEGSFSIASNNINSDTSGGSSSENQAVPASSVPSYDHKLYKHMLTGNSNYILPYPRPGRLSE